MAYAQVGPIPNCAESNKTLRQAAVDKIACIQFADLFRGAGTRSKEKDKDLVRIDVQGVTTGVGDSNIQVQINQRKGQKGPSTIAHVIVAAALGAAQGAGQGAVVGDVQQGLRASLKDRHTYRVT